MLAVLGVLTTVLPATALAVPPSCIRAALPRERLVVALGTGSQPSGRSSFGSSTNPLATTTAIASVGVGVATAFMPTLPLSTRIERSLRRILKAASACYAAWFAFSLKRAGSAANPERRRAGQPIKCPWPFVLVALPSTALGRRSLRAGFFDWQTWVVISLLVLGIRV